MLGKFHVCWDSRFALPTTGTIVWRGLVTLLAILGPSLNPSVSDSFVCLVPTNPLMFLAVTSLRHRFGLLLAYWAVMRGRISRHVVFT